MPVFLENFLTWGTWANIGTYSTFLRPNAFILISYKRKAIFEMLACVAVSRKGGKSKWVREPVLASDLLALHAFVSSFLFPSPSDAWNTQSWFLSFTSKLCVALGELRPLKAFNLTFDLLCFSTRKEPWVSTYRFVWWIRLVPCEPRYFADRYLSSVCSVTSYWTSAYLQKPQQWQVVFDRLYLFICPIVWYWSRLYRVI